MSKSIVNGRASICQWELVFYFLDKQQVRQFIKLLLKEEVDFDFEYEYVLAETVGQHYVTVQGSWANNLTQLGKLLEKVDYRMDS